MQKLIAKYGLAAHLALVAVAPLFLSPTAVLWLSALAAVWMFMSPSCIGVESLHAARVRVARAVVRDPLAWVLLGGALFAGVRALNGGVALAYDAEALVWKLAQPTWAYLPGSAAGAGYVQFACWAAALVLLEGCRLAMGKAARFAFLSVASVLVAMGGLTYAMMLREGVPCARALVEVSLQNPTYPGAAYGVYFVASGIALVAAFERNWYRLMPFLLLAVVGNGVAVFLFSPPTVILLAAVLLLLLLPYQLVYLRQLHKSGSDFRFLMILGSGLALAFLIVHYVAPPALLAQKTAPFLTGEFLTADFLKLREALSAISLKIWKAHPWIGHGLGSYPLSLRFNASAADWSLVSPLQTSPLNGYWMLLAERGIVGAFVLAVPAVMLVVAFVRACVGGLRAGLPHPACWFGLLLAAAAAAEGLVSVTLLTPGLMLSVAALLSISSRSFPKENRHG